VANEYKDGWLIDRCIPCTLSPLLYMHAAMRRIPVIGGGELSLLSQPWLHSFTDIHHLFDMSVLLSHAGLVLLFRACPGLMMTFLVLRSSSEREREREDDGHGI
jgi:hypothetical protein